jgi:drug/metabolite transporter (DMT)-like permease
MDLELFALLVIAMSSVSAGEVLLKMGMDEIGEISIRSLDDLLHVPLLIFQSRWLLVAIPLMGVHFYAYLTLLSRADLSFVLPLTSVSFVIGALLARYVLNEDVTLTRWVGTLVICLGVYLVASGQARTDVVEAEEPAPTVVANRSYGT